MSEPILSPVSTHRTLIGTQNLLTRLLFFKGLPIFANLTANELTNLVRDFTRREFSAGDSIFQQGDSGEVLYLIELGQVRIFVQGRDGQELSVILHGPGDIFGEMALIDKLPRSASAVVTEAAVVYALTRDSFEEHTRRSPQLAHNFMTALSLRLRYSSEMVGNLALLDVSSRLARKLLDLAQTHGQPDGHGLKIDQALTQSELASLIGTTRESINKALGNFKKQNLIKVEQGTYTLLDPEALKVICG
jgi:CRP/FNR family transcriptional regulator, cyclic AMP receptor protein